MTDYDKIETVKNTIIDLLKQCGIAASVEFEDSITKGLVFNIATPDSYLIIGRQGLTLHALQTLVQAMASRRLGAAQPFYFTLDVDDYKRKREWLIKETAKAAADKTRLTGRAQALEPMPNYERRLVHAYLQEHCPDVFSESMGNDPHRKVVIKPKR